MSGYGYPHPPRKDPIPPQYWQVTYYLDNTPQSFVFGTKIEALDAIQTLLQNSAGTLSALSDLNLLATERTSATTYLEWRDQTFYGTRLWNPK